MVQRQKAKSKTSRRAKTKSQSERFKEAARKIIADESGKKFEDTFSRIVPPKLRPKN